MNKINAKIKVTNVTGSNANMNKSINKTNLDTKVLIKKAKKIQKYTNDNDVVEKDGHLKDYHIRLRKLIVPQLWSFSKLPKHTVDMMVGMIKPPVLAVVFHHNIPPFSAQQFVGILLNPR